MIFTLFWARSTIHCDLCDSLDRYLTLDKHGNKYVVELMDMRHTPEGLDPFTLQKFETKNYDDAIDTFRKWVNLFKMGMIHEVDNSETYEFIESQHD